jgi:hypothetical protein
VAVWLCVCVYVCVFLCACDYVCEYVCDYVCVCVSQVYFVLYLYLCALLCLLGLRGGLMSILLSHGAWRVCVQCRALQSAGWESDAARVDRLCAAAADVARVYSDEARLARVHACRMHAHTHTNS